MDFRFLKTKFIQAFNSIKPGGNWKLLLIACACIVVCSSSLFTLGSMTDDAKKEEISYKFASLAKNDTIYGDYCACIIEKKEGAKESLPSPYNEFLQLRGLFRQSDFVYASTFNADKSHSIYLNDLDNNINQTILCSDRFTNRKRSDGYFAQEVYPIDLFFEGVKTSHGDYSWCYISESQAKEILIKREIEPVEDNYFQLISTSIDISFDDRLYSVTIGNIYMERGGYFKNLTKTVGSFILMPPKTPENFKDQACYFFTPFPYQNSFYIERIKTLYDSASFSLRIGEYNLKTTSNIDSCLKCYYYSSYAGLTTLFWISFAVFTLGITFLVIICFKKMVIDNNGNCLIIFLVFLLSFYVFRIIYLATGSILFFSHNSLICFSILFLIFVIGKLARIIFIARRKKKC